MTLSNIAISVDTLGKRYRLSSNRPANALRDVLTSSLRSLVNRRVDPQAQSPDFIWALKDVSFEVEHGEVVGIIGRNGSGKSTLLKILARITRPTEGRADVDGRLGSLLEVGTGFHGELSGRENIYLCGAILGMKKEEIRRRFDEIVAFAEVERFLDTPVKHYSSGMYIRLGFAVAAHLEPEILLVDEVLAVGDLVFQRKCLGKMHDVARAGRTVLFVSHDLGAINTLCKRVLLLNNGRIIRSGDTHEVVQHYLDAETKLYSPLRDPVDDRGEFHLHGVEVTQHNRATTVVDCRSPFEVCFDYDVPVLLRNTRLALTLRNTRGEVIFATSDYDEPANAPVARGPGRFRSAVTIPGKLLKTGTIHGTILLDIRGDRIVFAAVDVLHIDVIDLESDANSERNGRDGTIAPILEWSSIALAPPVSTLAEQRLRADPHERL